MNNSLHYSSIRFFFNQRLPGVSDNRNQGMVMKWSTTRRSTSLTKAGFEEVGLSSWRGWPETKISS